MGGREIPGTTFPSLTQTGECGTGNFPTPNFPCPCGSQCRGALPTLSLPPVVHNVAGLFQTPLSHPTPRILPTPAPHPFPPQLQHAHDNAMYRDLIRGPGCFSKKGCLEKRLEYYGNTVAFQTEGLLGKEVISLREPGCFSKDGLLGKEAR